MGMRIRSVALSLAAALLFASLGAARAADWPSRPVRIIVPFGASGVTDIVARIVFDKGGQQIGQQVVIENRPGAGGTIATDIVAHAAPDGYTLIMADPSGSLSANVSLYPKLNYDAARDLAPIAMI